MAYVLRFYCADRLIEQDLAALAPMTVGSSPKDTVQLQDCGLAKHFLKINPQSQGWDWQAAKALLQGDQAKTKGTLKYGELLVIDAERQEAVTIYERVPDHTQVVDLSVQGKVLLGRSNACDITIASPMVSGRHLELVRNGAGWLASDLGSANGIYHNGVRKREAQLASGDTLDLGLCRLILTGDVLTISYAGAVQVNLVGNPPIKTAQTPEDEYPHLFKRSPRLFAEIPSLEMDCQTAPGIGGKPTVSWASVLITPLASVSVMLAATLMMGGPLTMLYFSVPMTLVGLLMAVYNYKKQCKQYRQTEALRLAKYEEYLDEQESTIQSLHKEQRNILINIHPVTADCLAIVTQPARRLWERRPEDEDFMTLRLGEGELPSCVKLRLPQQTLALEEDALANRPRQLAERYRTVPHCPIVWQGGAEPTCGMIGQRTACIRLAKNLVIQAVTHHSYDELRLVTLLPRAELAAWDFVKWLPHSFDDAGSRRYIADDPWSAKALLADLQAQLMPRKQEESRSGSDKAARPHYLFICADSTLLEQHPIMAYLLANQPAYGVSALFLYDELNNLPKECGVIVEAREQKGTVYHKSNAAERASFLIDPQREDLPEALARAMAPIRITAGSGQGTLPTSLTFLQGYGVKKPQEIPVTQLWPKARPEQSMAVPIGVGRSGEPFLFDIHEKHHGPHGLVAGMTGSGKSEMVQSWILSMALAFPPEAVSFVLIDFKGTGLILPFRSLPHLAGTVSDLDTNISRNLIALENELTRRKALLDAHQVNNIAGYLKLYRQGKATEALSYLFIVIDEFAEFKVQFPDFMQVVSRVFAIGRTLGVHMLLLTQKPGNVVDDKMNANTRFRWCLKVASSADSKDMLRHPDAARITNPGRAFVQVGEDEIFEEIQSYWSGAPYNPHHDPALKLDKRILAVDLYGGRQSFEAEKTTGFRADRNEIDGIVELLDDITRKNQLPRAHNIWTQKLPATLALEEILQIAFDGERWSSSDGGFAPIVGQVDDPRTQSQYPFRLNLTEEGNFLLYGAPGTGKTTFLQSFILSTALLYSPEQVHMYLLDLGGGSLRTLGALPHVGGVALGTDAEAVNALCHLVSEELDRRRLLFAEQGVTGLNSYREVSNSSLPYIVLALDNFAAIMQQYGDLAIFFETLTREGLGYGIYLVATANAQNAVPYRVAQNIRGAAALNMPDKGDYAAIVGRTEGMVPENLPGRGLLKGKHPLELQIALPTPGQTEGERLLRLRELVGLMNRQWQGSRPTPLPLMPEKVKAADYPGQGLVLGLSVVGIAPLALDPGKNPFLLVSCAGAGELPELWQALTAQIPVVLPDAEIILCDGSARGQRGAALDSRIAALMPVLQERKDRKDRLNQQDPANQQGQQEPGGPQTKDHWIVILVGDLSDSMAAAAPETAKRLANVVNLGKGLNVAMLAGGQGADIARLYHSGDAFTLSLVSKGTVLLLGGSFRDHEIHRGSLGFAEAGEPLGPAEAWVVSNNQAQKIKTVTPA